MTASEWRQEQESGSGWEQASGDRVAEWRQIKGGKLRVVVVPNYDGGAGIFITAPASAAAIVARAGEQVGCPWLERGGWPLVNGLRMVQVGEDVVQALQIAELLRTEHRELADAIAAVVAGERAWARRQRRAHRRVRQAPLFDVGAPHALAA